MISWSNQLEQKGMLLASSAVLNSVPSDVSLPLWLRGLNHWPWCMLAGCDLWVVGSNRTRGAEVYRLCGVHTVGLNSQTGAEGSPVSSLICIRWQWLNLEVFNCCLHCQVDTDAAVCIGGAKCLACPLLSSQFWAGFLAHTALSGSENWPLYRLGALASISTKPLPLTTQTHNNNNNID